MATNANIGIFQKLEKFSGKNSDDFSSWLRGFERCCVIAGKSGDDQDLVKGQLLMLCLCGQALAIADRFEQAKKTPQKFTDLKEKLETVFNSDADKEFKQEEFERRRLQLNETEDEFMLSLIKLHRAANPNSSDADHTRDVKRKFMSGISPELKRSVFIFCNNPHEGTVTIDALSEATRKAKLYTLEKCEAVESVNVVNGDNQEDHILQAIESLKESLNGHIQSTSEQLKEHNMQLNAITDINSRDGYQNQSRFQSRPRNRGRGYYSHNQDNSVPRGRGQSNRGNNRRNQILCYKCNGPNHIARYCTSEYFLNSERRLLP